MNFFPHYKTVFFSLAHTKVPSESEDSPESLLVLAFFSAAVLLVSLVLVLLVLHMGDEGCC